MGYKKITVGFAKNTLTISGLYLGKFQRFGQNKLKWVDELRTSKGSQLKRSFQIWHTERNNFVVLSLNRYSKWKIDEFDNAEQILKWLGSEEMYNDLVRYSHKIHGLPSFALPPLDKMKDFKPQTVRSQNWRRPYQAPKPTTLDHNYIIGDDDYFTERHRVKIEDSKIEVNEEKVEFFGLDEETIKRFAEEALKLHLQNESVKKSLKRI